MKVKISRDLESVPGFDTGGTQEIEISLGETAEDWLEELYESKYAFLEKDGDPAPALKEMITHIFDLGIDAVIIDSSHPCDINNYRKDRYVDVERPEKRSSNK